MANYTFDEIHQQPAMWRKELKALLAAKAEVSAFTLEKICAVLECQPGDLMEYIPDEQA